MHVPTGAAFNCIQLQPSVCMYVGVCQLCSPGIALGKWQQDELLLCFGMQSTVNVLLLHLPLHVCSCKRPMRTLQRVAAYSLASEEGKGVR